MITRAWKVYGAYGHRQRESFCSSYKYDWSNGDNVRIVEVENSDKTGTNEYSIIRITRNTAEECRQELDGQISDGIFENSRVGKIEEISKSKCKEFELRVSDLEEKVIHLMKVVEEMRRKGE